VTNPSRVRFGRILVETDPYAADGALKSGLASIQEILYESGTTSLCVYHGGTGAALWIPFSDAPAYAIVRLWLHAQRAKAVEVWGKYVTLEPNSCGGGLAHLHVASNAVGRFSVFMVSA
jgi:hypothetical protein